MTLIDVSKQWIKARSGTDVSETPRDIAFCSYVLLESAPDVVVVRDATQDPRFQSNPMVQGFPHIRFYAGTPLCVNGIKLGTLCIIDMAPRNAEQFGDREASMLQDIAAMLSALIVERYNIQTGIKDRHAHILATIEEEKTLMSPDECDVSLSVSGLDREMITRIAAAAKETSILQQTQSLSLNGGINAAPWKMIDCNVQEEVARLKVLSHSTVSTQQQKANDSIQHAIDSFSTSLSAPLLYSYPELFSLVLSTLSPHSLQKTKLERMGLQWAAVKEHPSLTVTQLQHWVDLDHCNDTERDRAIRNESGNSWEEGFVMLSFSYLLYGSTVPSSVEVLKRLLHVVKGYLSVDLKQLSKSLSSMLIRVGIPCILLPYSSTSLPPPHKRAKQSANTKSHADATSIVATSFVTTMWNAVFSNHASKSGKIVPSN